MVREPLTWILLIVPLLVIVVWAIVPIPLVTSLSVTLSVPSPSEPISGTLKSVRFRLTVAPEDTLAYAPTPPVSPLKVKIPVVRIAATELKAPFWIQCPVICKGVVPY